MRDVYVVIEKTESEWGPSVAKMTVPDTVYDHEIYRELDYAKRDLEDKGIPEDWGTGELNDEILNIAAEILGAKWEYVGIVEFKYEYDGLYLEEEEDLNEKSCV